VPVHPQTGQTWAPAGLAASAYPVPLPLGVWLRMTSLRPHLLSGRVPRDISRDIVRDYPPLPFPYRPFRVDQGTFRHALVRLPAVRSPWLRRILENLTQHAKAGFF
jgi:hypothetical protein